MTDHSQIATETPTSAAGPADRQYDMRRLSYAGTFKNPWKAGTIRALEWLTAKLRLLSLIRSFEKSGAPHGAPFWPKAIRHMGIRIDTPPEEIARIPATGPLVVVSNHPSGLVDGMVLAEMINRVRSDFKILTRSTLSSKETVKWEDGNEYPLVKIEVSSSSHPFYTGQNKLIDTSGRVDKFRKRYAK